MPQQSHRLRCNCIILLGPCRAQRGLVWPTLRAKLKPVSGTSGYIWGTPKTFPQAVLVCSFLGPQKTEASPSLSCSSRSFTSFSGRMISTAIFSLMAVNCSKIVLGEVLGAGLLHVANSLLVLVAAGLLRLSCLHRCLRWSVEDIFKLEFRSICG